MEHCYEDIKPVWVKKIGVRGLLDMTPGGEGVLWGGRGESGRVTSLKSLVALPESCP
jgi:hypothetical protein